MSEDPPRCHIARINFLCRLGWYLFRPRLDASALCVYGFPFALGTWLDGSACHRLAIGLQSTNISLVIPRSLLLHCFRKNFTPLFHFSTISRNRVDFSPASFVELVGAAFFLPTTHFSASPTIITLLF